MTTIRYTCGGCDTTWTGVSRCHCSGCHRTFSGLKPFDQHRHLRHGDGYCVDPAAIVSEAGIRRMFVTDGIWQGVENPAARNTENLRRKA